MTDAMPRLNPAAFVWALVLAPLSLGLLSAVLSMLTAGAGLYPLTSFFGVSGVATVIGLPTYLTFGTVAFLRALERPAPSLLRFALNGLLAHLASMPIVLIVLLIGFRESGFGLALGFLALGAVFAPLWSVIFGLLYRRFSRSIPRRPA